MPSQQEYAAAFNEITLKWYQTPWEKKAQRRTQEVQMHAELRKKRDEFTREITKIWKEKYKEIKEENDMLQKALKEAWIEEATQLDEFYSTS